MTFLQMKIKLNFLCTRISAKLTFKRFISQMNHNVSFHPSFTFHYFYTIWTCPSTRINFDWKILKLARKYQTLVWKSIHLHVFIFLFVSSKNVILKCGLLTGGIRTKFTYKWFFSNLQSEFLRALQYLLDISWSLNRLDKNTFQYQVLFHNLIVMKSTKMNSKGTFLTK